MQLIRWFSTLYSFNTFHNPSISHILRIFQIRKRNPTSSPGTSLQPILMGTVDLHIPSPFRNPPPFPYSPPLFHSFSTLSAYIIFRLIFFNTLGKLTHPNFSSITSLHLYNWTIFSFFQPSDTLPNFKHLEILFYLTFKPSPPFLRNSTIIPSTSVAFPIFIFVCASTITSLSVIVFIYSLTTHITT